MAVDKAKILKSAEKFIAQGKIQQAVDEYLKILKENPRDWNLMIQVGDLLLKINKTAEAIQHFQKVADHYYIDGFYLKAIAIYKRINKLDPNLTDICIKLADLYLKQGLTMDAKSQLQVVAQHYVSKNQTKDAIQTLRKLVEIEPDNLRTRNELAKAFKNEGMIAEAVNEYMEISDELLRKNLVKESLTVLETACKMDTRNAAILRKMLAIYNEQNEQDKATALLEESLRSDPANPDVLGLLAESYADEGDYSRAHQTIDQAIFHTGNKEPFWILKADLYLKEGDLDKAYTQFEPAIDRQLKRKDPEKAIGLLQKILKLDSSFHPALQRLTDIYSTLKQTPNLVTTYNQLVDALISKTLYKQALTALEKLMELEPDNEQHQEKLDFVKSFVGSQPAEEEPEPIAASIPEPEPVEEPVSEDFDISIDLETPEEPQTPEVLETPALLEEPFVSAPASTSASATTSIQEITHVAAKKPTPPLKPLPPVPPAPVAVEESPNEERDFVSEHLIEADVFTKYGLIEKAIEQLQIITGRYPNSVVAHQKLKEIYLEKGERGKAVEECVLMSKMFRKQGDMDQAEDLLSEARQIDPNHPSLEKAFKEMPATISSTDVLSEIERLAQSLKKIPAKPKAAKKAPAPKPAPEPEIVLKEEPKIEIQEPHLQIQEPEILPQQPEIGTHRAEIQPISEPEIQIEELSDNVPIIPEALFEKTPVSQLDAEKFDEVDFYIDQGLLDEAARVLAEMRQNFPNETGILSRLWKLKEKGIVVPEKVEEEVKEEPLEELTPVAQIGMDRKNSASANNEDEMEPEATEESLTEIAVETEEVQEIEEENSSSNVQLEEVPDELFETPVPEEITDPHDEETPVGTWATLEAMSGIRAEESAESLFQQKSESGEQTWDLGDLSELSDNVLMVPEQEEDSLFDKAMGAAIDLASGAQVDEDEEEDAAIDQRFPYIQEKEETSFDELEPEGFHESGDEDVEVPYIPVESEVDAALDAAFAGEPNFEDEDEVIEESKPVQATPELFEEEEDYFDLAAELEEGLLSVQSAIEEKPADGQNYSLEEILSDFRKGVEKQLGSEDYDTRYNLGIAYKEMGLIDEAIAEFQIASKDPKRFLECCSMLGLCFVEKGMPKLAVKWYQRGLETGGFTEEEYQGLKYEMAQACEVMGDLEKALEFYQEVYVVNAGYRNVAKKVKELTDHFRSKERPT
jgi:tetratricopeptide (TPR) repeat protein